MTVFTGIILYLLIWWLALFCVLPIGTRPDQQGKLEEGGWRRPEPLLLAFKREIGRASCRERVCLYV